VWLKRLREPLTKRKMLQLPDKLCYDKTSQVWLI
jgi:hypothetical protein